MEADIVVGLSTWLSRSCVSPRRSPWAPPPPPTPTLVPLHPSLFPRQGDVWGVDGVRGSLLLSGVRQGCLSTGHFGAVQA